LIHLLKRFPTPWRLDGAAYPAFPTAIEEKKNES
jgi:hypothetical protein